MRKIVFALLIIGILTAVIVASASAQGMVVCKSSLWDYGLVSDGAWGQLGTKDGPFGFDNVETKIENGVRVTTFHVGQAEHWNGRFYIWSQNDIVGASYIVPISGDGITQEYSCNPPYEELMTPTPS